MEIDADQSSFNFSIDGEVVYTQTITGFSTYDSLTCYLGSPWYDAADVNVSNLIIYSSADESKSNAVLIEDIDTSTDIIRIECENTESSGGFAATVEYQFTEYSTTNSLDNGTWSLVFNQSISSSLTYFGPISNPPTTWNTTDLSGISDDAYWVWADSSDIGTMVFEMKFSSTTDAPTTAPTATPTADPTKSPTSDPTGDPTVSPTPTSFQISFVSESLSSDEWTNEGTLGSNYSITNLTGTVNTTTLDGGDTLETLCFYGMDNAITYIDYDTNPSVRPELTMEVWLKISAYNGYTWILGHDDAILSGYGYDRAILVYDTRYGGIAAGIGASYTSTVDYPALDEWTHIVVTYSDTTGEAVVYKNGGSLGNGSNQSVTTDNSGSVLTRIGLNGLEAYPDSDHEINGCFAQVQLTNRAIAPAEVAELYETFDAVINAPGPSMEPTSPPTASPLAFGPIDFDVNSTINFTERTMNIGWIPFSTCQSGSNPSIYNEDYGYSELLDLAQYAVTGT